MDLLIFSSSQSHNSPARLYDYVAQVLPFVEFVDKAVTSHFTHFSSHYAHHIPNSSSSTSQAIPLFPHILFLSLSFSLSRSLRLDVVMNIFLVNQMTRVFYQIQQRNHITAPSVHHLCGLLRSLECDNFVGPAAKSMNA